MHLKCASLALYIFINNVIFVSLSERKKKMLVSFLTEKKKSIYWCKFNNKKKSLVFFIARHKTFKIHFQCEILKSRMLQSLPVPFNNQNICNDIDAKKERTIQRESFSMVKWLEPQEYNAA